MVERTRERIFDSFGPGSGGRQIVPNPPIVSNDPQDGVLAAKHWKRCIDHIGTPGIDHPLSITERDNRGFKTLSGRVDLPSGSYSYYDNYLPDGFTTPVSHIFTSIPSTGTRATTLRARTNPSREEVSIPNFLYEMKDLPHMIRNMKNLTPLLRNLKHRNDAAMSAVASQYLGYEFGWKPLVSDISQLLQFQSQVDRRILELNRLYSGTGLKRRLNLFDANMTESRNLTVESAYGYTIRVRQDTVTRTRSWGTIRWRPTVVPKDIGHQQLGRTARKLVHGIHHLGVDATQAWNMLPFSWLGDWFGNFGEWLAAHRNDVPAAPTGPCNIMTLQETYELWTRIDGNTVAFKGADGMRILRTKVRAQSSGTLSAHLPLATARQFSILAALNLQRKKR